MGCLFTNMMKSSMKMNNLFLKYSNFNKIEMFSKKIAKENKRKVSKLLSKA